MVNYNRRRWVDSRTSQCNPLVAVALAALVFTDAIGCAFNGANVALFNTN
jgi:hypothetical protein